MTAPGPAPRFSRRIQLPQEQGRLPLAVEERRRRGAPVLDLTSSDPTRAGFRSDEARIRALLDGPAALLHEPEPFGLWDARLAIARMLQEDEGIAVPPGRLLVTASTSESFGFLFQLLCDPGDGVLLPEPGYPLLPILAGLHGVRPVRYPLRWDGEWHVDPDAIRDAFRAPEPPIRALVVVHPGSPTGAFLKKAELAALAAICREQGCALVADRVFAPFAAGPDPRRAGPLAALGDLLTFSLGGLSKSCGLPQLKLGYCAIGGPEEQVAAALPLLEQIADAALSVAAPVQRAVAEGLLETRHGFQAQVRARCASNRAALAAAQGPAATWDALPGEGGWSAVVRVPSARSDEETALALLDRGLLVQPGHWFDLPPGHLVLSLIGPEEEFARGVELLARSL